MARWRLGRGLQAAWDLTPLTGLGALVAALSALAVGRYGVEELDLVLLGAGIVGLSAVAMAVVGVGLGALRLSLALRGAPRTGEPVRLECGSPYRSDLRLPRLWYLPNVRATWRWSSPPGRVRVLRQGLALGEEVTVTGRAWTDGLERRFVVEDVFGLSRVRFGSRVPRPVRALPSTGGLRSMHVVRTLAGGADLAHPEGSPEGDRLDLRAYAPGDPIRYVLWSVFARTRELVVRTPEKALSASRKTLAYQVAGDGDEAAAGAARVAVDMGALGGEWALGADGVPAPAETREAALEALARSAEAWPDEGGAGLLAFLEAAGHGTKRTVVFVPAKPGPWIEGVARAARNVPRDAAGRSPLEFVVCMDGVREPPRRTGLARLALRPPPGDAADGEGTVSSADLAQVVQHLGALGGRVVVVDRRDGRAAPY